MPDQVPAREEQARERRSTERPVGVFHLPVVAHVGIAKYAIDHIKGMLDVAVHFGLGAIFRVLHIGQWTVGTVFLVGIIARLRGNCPQRLCLTGAGRVVSIDSADIP
jgi:hypothetical protein